MHRRSLARDGFIRGAEMLYELNMAAQGQGSLAALSGPKRNVPGYVEGISRDDRQIAVAAFRRHPHINSVLTHISGANWLRVEKALRAILDPLTAGSDLSPLARNIVDLMCADRGVTGRILKPYFRGFLSRILSPHLAVLLTDHVVTLLFLEFELGGRLAEGTVR
jgi:hypothetical protein